MSDANECNIVVNIRYYIINEDTRSLKRRIE